MANTKGEKELKTDWPIEEGLEAKTEKQTGRVTNLVPQGISGQTTTVLQRNRVLLDG